MANRLGRALRELVGPRVEYRPDLIERRLADIAAPIRKASLPGRDLQAQAVAVTGLADLARSLTPSTQTLGPGVPIQPFHQDEEEPRRWAYRAGYNVQMQPRAGEAISFRTLQALGRGYDVCNLARYKRIDGIRSLEWTVEPVPIKGQSRTQAKQREESLGDQIAAATSFWNSPNQEDPFGVWVGQYLDDLWTIDAATMYLRPNRAGGLFGVEVVDGTTIRPIIDLYGRPPMPPEPAYGQVIFGMTWTMFDRDQMVYQPYWQTTDSPYGFPPTEWIILAINRALRRQTQDLTNFTEGTLPVAFLRVAAQASGQDLKDLRVMLDEMLAGNDVARSRVIPVPGGAGTGLDLIHPEPKNEVEEWLMHLTCAAHGVAPSELGFIAKGSGLGGKGFSEGVADTSKVREKALAQHVAGLLTAITQGRLGFPELRFTFDGLEDVGDSLQKAQTTKIYVDMGARSADDVAEEDLDLDAPGLPNYVMTASGPILVTDIINPPEPVVAIPPAPGGTASPDQAPLSVLGDEPPGQAVGGGKAAPAVAKTADGSEVEKWRRKALRSFREGNGALTRFEVRDIPEDRAVLIRERLAKASSADDVRSAFVFGEVLAKAGASGRPLAEPRASADSGPSGASSSGEWAPPSSRGFTSGRRQYP